MKTIKLIATALNLAYILFSMFLLIVGWFGVPEGFVNLIGAFFAKTIMAVGGTLAFWICVKVTDYLSKKGYVYSL